jgi:hypothetical protein
VGVSVRGFLIPLLVYCYVGNNSLKYIDIIKICGSIIYFSILSILIAIMKDIPDHKGDSIHGIKTFSLHYGSARIMSFSKIVLRVPSSRKLNLVKFNLFAIQTVPTISNLNFIFNVIF